jgi:putative endonuclease
MAGSLSKGLHFEDFARDYLAKLGLRFLEKNYHCRYGEIDLIMRDRETVCFIEVKYRKTLDFGGAAYSISPSKQRKIIKTAMFYSAQHKNLTKCALRIDAFLIQHQSDGSNQINWIQNAFYAE